MLAVVSFPSPNAMSDEENESQMLLSEEPWLAEASSSDVREVSHFEAFIRRHQDSVYNFCVRMLGDREEAFDMTQDIFVSVHAHAASFRGESHVTTWLFRIAKNHCLNRLQYLKRRGRGRSECVDEVNELQITDALGGSEQPDVLVSHKRTIELVHLAIAQLDEEQRALVVLRDVEGLSYEEIVEVTGVPEGTVKSRLHRAREKLAGILGKLEVFSSFKGE